MIEEKEMLKKEAEEYVKSCVRRELAADPEKKQEMVEPVLGIKMNRPLDKEDSDYPEDAVVVSYDEVNHRFHLYFMCSKTHKSIIMEKFDIYENNFVGDNIGHISFDTPEMSDLYLPKVKNFEEILKKAIEDYTRLYQAWTDALK